MITKSSSSSWIDYLKPNPHAQLRLFCFPYAGGSASIFRTWVNDLPPDLEVCPVQLPGRENRLMEPPFTRLSSLVQVLAQALFPYLDIPFAFFGHSMGALIGFELARELRRQNRPGPRHLFVSAHRAPQIPPRRPPIHQLAEAAFKAELDGLHGTPQEVLQSAELMQLLLPLLRADFAVSETYIYSPEAPLNCSISAYGGLQDKEVSYHDLEKWRDQTHRSFTLRMLPGNHFFVHSAQALLLQAVFQDLTTLLHGLTEAKAYDNYEFFTGLSTSSRVMRKRAVHQKNIQWRRTMKNSSATPTISTEKPGLLINRNFALLWSGQTISIVGDFVFETTLVLWIVTLIAQGQPWAPLAVSGILLAASLPVFIIGPIAGVFVDRWDKRRTMLWMDALRAIVILLLFLPATIRLPIFWQLGLIYSTVLLASTCAEFFEPSLLVLIGDIVDEPYRARATGLIQLMASLALIIGPALATLLFFTVGVHWALLLNAFSFVVSFLAILAIRPPEIAVAGELERQGNFLREFGQGIHFYAGNPVLMTILISGILVVFINGALNALDIFFVTQNLHTSVSLYGLLGAVLGAGLTVGAVLAGALAQRLGLTRTFWLSLVVGGVLVLVYARLTSFVPALVVLFLLGLVTTAVNVVAGPLVLHVTPRELIGRVASVLMPALNLATMLSVAVAGYLYSAVLQSFHVTLVGITFGPIDTIFTATGFLAIIGGLYAMVKLRGITLNTETEPSSEL